MARDYARRVIRIVQYTVNSEIFARTLFSRNFAAKFRENKTFAKWQNHSAVY